MNREEKIAFLQQNMGKIFKECLDDFCIIILAIGGFIFNES